MKLNIVLPLIFSLLCSFSLAQEAASPAIESAREAARIQFERDIGLAEAELLAAKAAAKNASGRLDALRSMLLAGRNIPNDFVLEEMEAAKETVAVVEKKRARRDFLRSEAARLDIPVTTVVKETPLKPSFAPVHNRANDQIVMKAADR